MNDGEVRNPLAKSDGAVRVSVVVVSFHTGPPLWACLDSVLGQDDCEVIVVDNGNPPDVTARLLSQAEREPAMTVLTGHGNIGFARACNLGARAATGEWLLFLNPDARLPPGGLARLIEEGGRHPSPRLIGARLVDADGREQRGARRETLTPWTALVEGARLDRLFPSWHRVRRFNRHDSPLPRETSPVPVISGACMLVPAADFWMVEGFDEGYFLHVEDIDFCYRFRRAGGEIFFVPDVVVTHQRGSSGAGALRVEWHKMRGFWRYFWKNYYKQTPVLLILLADFAALCHFVGKVARSVLIRRA